MFNHRPVNLQMSVHGNVTEQNPTLTQFWFQPMDQILDNVIIYEMS